MNIPPFDVPEWLPPDTEESVLGTQWHQEAIDALADMIDEVAQAARLAREVAEMRLRLSELGKGRGDAQ